MSWLSRPFLLRGLVAQGRLAWRLLREPVVPRLLKMVPVLAALYVVSPIDVVPDVLPLLGQLDDLGVLLLALQGFVNWCPANAVGFHRAAIAQGSAYRPMPGGGDVIDAEFRHEDPTR